MSALIRNLIFRFFNWKTEFPSAMPFAIAFIFMALFSRAENIKAYDYEMDKTASETVYQDSTKSINDEELLFEQTGFSSWYGHKFHNRKTANGERYNKTQFTAAHKTLPFGSIVRVTNLKNNKSVLVRINDRGPYVKKRIIDLSHRAAKELGALGNPKVKIETLLLPEKSFVMKDTATNYLFAYSFSELAAFVPADSFIIMQQYEDFNSAAEEYHKIASKFPNRKYFLLFDFDADLEEKDTSNKGIYYIGISRKDFDMSEFLPL